MVFLQPRKVVFNYIFFITSVTFVPQIHQLFIDQITIFLPPQLPFSFLFPLFRTAVKIPKFLFYIINLIFYSIFHLFSDFNLNLNFLILYCILFALKPFLILPITPSSQNVVHMPLCFCILKVCLLPPVMFRMSKSFVTFSSESCRDSFALIFCSFKFFVSFPLSFHGSCPEFVFYFQVKQVFFLQNIRQQNC